MTEVSKQPSDISQTIDSQMEKDSSSINKSSGDEEKKTTYNSLTYPWSKIVEPSGTRKWGQWAEVDATTIEVRSKDYIETRIKIPSHPMLTKLAQVELFKCTTNESSHIAKNPNSWYFQYRKELPLDTFYIIINLQLMSIDVSIVSYHILKTNQMPPWPSQKSLSLDDNIEAVLASVEDVNRKQSDYIDYSEYDEDYKELNSANNIPINNNNTNDNSYSYWGSLVSTVTTAANLFGLYNESTTSTDQTDNKSNNDINNNNNVDNNNKNDNSTLNDTVKNEKLPTTEDNTIKQNKHVEAFDNNNLKNPQNLNDEIQSNNQSLARNEGDIDNSKVTSENQSSSSTKKRLWNPLIGFDPLDKTQLWQTFLRNDNKFINDHLKLIPRVNTSTWWSFSSFIKPTIMGRYGIQRTYRGHNYLEIDCIADNTMMASSITKSAYSLSNSIVVDIVYVIEGNTSDELPERCLGGYTIMNLNVDNALPLSKSNENTENNNKENISNQISSNDVSNTNINATNASNNNKTNDDESDDDHTDLLAALELD